MALPYAASAALFPRSRFGQYAPLFRRGTATKGDVIPASKTLKCARKSVSTKKPEACVVIDHS